MFGGFRIHTSQCACKCLNSAKNKSSRRCQILAAQSPADEPQRGFSFRKKNTAKEEAARKALEGMFRGQKDILASFDTGGGGGGGSRFVGKKGTGGGDDGDWQLPDWRQWRVAAVRKLTGGSKALLALLGFIAVFLAIPLIPQTIGLSVRIVKVVLGLDGQARSARQQALQNSPQYADTANLGRSEIAVMSKYGTSDETADTVSSDGEEL